MSLFKKPKKNFRQRKANSDEEGEGDQQDKVFEIATSSENTKVQKSKQIIPFLEKKKKSNANVLLSFDDDHEEEEVFTVKKSSRSAKNVKKIKTQHRKEKEEKIAKSASKRMKVDGNINKDGVKKTTSPIKKEVKEEGNKILNGNEAVACEESGSESEEDEHTRFSHSFKTLFERGQIPDANLIHLARKRREAARETGDYVALEEPPKTENNKSRLMRDEDECSDDDERVAFTDNMYAADKQRMKDNFMAAEHNVDGYQSDENENEWEQQQIRKAVSIPQTDPKSAEYQYDMQAPPTEDTPSPTSLISLAPSQTPQVTVDQVKHKLKERLENMVTVHRAHTIEKQKLDDELITNISTIEELETQFGGLEARCAFFQEMRGYVRDLLECLNEKVPIISNIESRKLKALQSKSERLIRRRQKDVQDQAGEYNPSTGQHIPGVSGHEDSPRQRRVAEREARRARRRRGREKHNITDHKEGLSSDDEENNLDHGKFNKEMEIITSDTQRLFEDVVDDFCKIKRIKTRFEDWKHKYGDTYTEAYIGLCMPKLFGPFVRLQLLDWSPLEENTSRFEEMNWYQSLMFYGFREGFRQEDDDDDLKIIPNIVDKLLIPHIKVYIEKMWDPMSTTQSVNLVQVTGKLVFEFPIKNLESLMDLIVKRLRQSVNEDVYVPLYNKSIIENRSIPASFFYHRQLWGCIKMFKNILLWQSILNDKIIIELAVNGLLNRYILLGLSNCDVNPDFLDKCQSITGAIPKPWFSNLEDDNTVPQLESFCKLLVTQAAIMGRSSKDDVKETRDKIKQLIKLLVNIHAMDHAISLANQFSLKL